MQMICNNLIQILYAETNQKIHAPHTQDLCVYVGLSMHVSSFTSLKVCVGNSAELPQKSENVHVFARSWVGVCSTSPLSQPDQLPLTRTHINERAKPHQSLMT